ncbi:MAG: hypothetical protein ACJ8AE_00540 [Gemmatimonadaceae bacterium]
MRLRLFYRVSTGLVLGLRVFGANADAQTQPHDLATLGPAASHALRLRSVQWLSRKTEHATIYVAAGSAAEPQLGSLERGVEAAISANLAWLHERPRQLRLRLFFVGSRNDMAPLTGATHGGTSFTDEGTAFFVTNDSVRPALKHEIMHLLSWRLWGTPRSMWMSEGVATAAVGPCRGYRLSALVAALDAAGRLLPLDSLRHDFVVAGEVGAVHYLEAASLVTFIDSTYGRQRLRNVWRRGLKTNDNRSGLDAAGLERVWRAEVKHQKPAKAWSAIWPEIRAHGCE